MSIGTAAARRRAWWWLTAAIVCNNAGNALVKAASHGTDGGLGIFTTPDFVAGAGLFALGFVTYARALAVLPLALAYSTLIATSILAASLTGSLAFDEALGPRQILGLLLVVAGLLALTLSGQSAPASSGPTGSSHPTGPADSGDGHSLQSAP